MLYLGGEWSLRRALNTEDPNPASPGEPHLDWFAEYSRTEHLSQDSWAEFRVRVSGHFASSDRLRRDYEHFGFELSSREVGGKHAVWGSGPEGRPVVVVYELAPDYSVLLLSHDLHGGELLNWAEGVREVDEAEWVAAGGTFWSCAPAGGVDSRGQPSGFCPP